MPAKALFVDLPNFYSRFLESCIDEPRVLRDYFLEWFDFDRLAEKLTSENSSVWVFYSGRRFGPSENRIHEEYLDNFISRINSLKGVTARDVNIPGQQREPAKYKCEECQHEGTAQWESEKGIDASLTVHLFDTFDAWDTAYLLSGDADFVPTVASLRRRGKIVVGAGFPDASPALVRECYEYIDLCNVFLREDVAAYQIFKKDGIVSAWLRDRVAPQSDIQDYSEPVELAFKWQVNQPVRWNPEYQWLSIHDAPTLVASYQIYLFATGPIELSSRVQQLEQFKGKYPLHFGSCAGASAKYCLIVSPLAWIGVKRRLDNLISTFDALRAQKSGNMEASYTLRYSYDHNTGSYKPLPIDHQTP